MTETRFNQVPQNYHKLLLEAEKHHGTCIRIIEELRSGYSGARLFDAIESKNTGDSCDQIKELTPDSSWRLIIKVDHGEISSQNESAKLGRARGLASDEFKLHIVSERWDPIVLEDKIAYFYNVAGNSTFTLKPLSSFEEKDYLSNAFSQIFSLLIDKWDTEKKQKFTSPAEMLKGWLEGDFAKSLDLLHQNLKDFNISSEISGLVINNSPYAPALRLRAERASALRSGRQPP